MPTSSFCFHPTFVRISCLAIACLLTPAAVFAQYGEVAPPPEKLAEGFNSISAEQCKEWLGVLAGPEFEGRGTGQTGYVKAAHWVAGKVAEFGLEPIGDGGTYFQIMPLDKRYCDLKSSKIVGPDGFEVAAEGNLGIERYTDSGEVSGEVVFLTLNGENAALPDDVQLRDKIVMYTADEAAQRRATFIVAPGRPAASFRIIESEPISSPQTLFPGHRRRSTSVSGTIKRSAVAELVKGLGSEVDWSEENAAVESGKKVQIQLRLVEEKAGAPNVVAFLEGSDPELKNEYVVIGAHLDHLGKRGDRVYPGADDNGSGSTAILSIAKAMAANPVKPKRSVLFIWFTAEENGLVGSRYYTDNPILPLDKMTCMFNIDMVGRNEDAGEGDTDADNEGHIHLVGSQRGETQLHNIVLAANKHVGFEFELDMESVWNRSDQVNFYNKGVPVAFMFGGFHPDYHQPTDQISKINYKKIASAARLYYMAIHGASDHGRFKMKKEESR